MDLRIDVHVRADGARAQSARASCNACPPPGRSCVWRTPSAYVGADGLAVPSRGGPYGPPPSQTRTSAIRRIRFFMAQVRSRRTVAMNDGGFRQRENLQ